MDFSSSDIQRFWSKVNKGPVDECWIWTGTRNNKQYGKLIINGKWYGAHRLSWMLHTAEDPGSLFVCHKCDTPLCVNPNHMFLGTNADNMRDCVSKGRMKGGPAPGEAHNKAKLKNCDIPVIRERIAAGERHVDIANSFNVSRGVISKIGRGDIWKHIP